MYCSTSGGSACPAADQLDGIHLWQWLVGALVGLDDATAGCVDSSVIRLDGGARGQRAAIDVAPALAILDAAIRQVRDVAGLGGLADDVRRPVWRATARTAAWTLRALNCPGCAPGR